MFVEEAKTYFQTMIRGIKLSRMKAKKFKTGAETIRTQVKINKTRS